MTGTELVITLGDRLYSVERPWGVLPEGIALARPGDVAVDSQDHVYVYQRADPPVVVLDPSGEYVRSWGTGLIAHAHGIFITPDDMVLLVDNDTHQVLGFDSQGHLEFTLGERNRPSFQAPFNHPTNVAVAPNGDIYVTDGYGNSSVHCFGADGEWIHSWGRPGSGPGEFSTPHAVWVDDHNRVLVADRENNRVQLFDADGKYITEWGNLYHPMDIFIGTDGMAYVTDQTPRLSLFAPDGTLVGRCRPTVISPHGVWGDSKGNLFLAELGTENRITRLTPMS
jgi:DNA-binding beta-propeller fold protein YncE